MSAFSWPAQQALYAALVAANLPGVGVGAAARIYDGSPQNVAFPWIEIGDGQIIPDGTGSSSGGTDDGVSEFFDLHVWARGDRGKKQIKELVDSIFTALNGASLTITGRTSALAWVRNVRTLTDPDGLTTHAVVSVEIIHRS